MKSSSKETDPQVPKAEAVKFGIRDAIGKMVNDEQRSDWLCGGVNCGQVSVVIPAYNRAHCIEETLGSVLAQTYRPIEVIVVDDASTDATCSVVREWQARHASDGFDVTLVERPHEGVDSARNHGVAASHGEFIQYLDSDDILHPAKLSESVAAFSSPDVDAVVSRFEKFQRIEEIRTRLETAPVDAQPTLAPDRKPFYARMGWEMWGPVYRRSLIARAGPMPGGIAAGGAHAYTTRLKLCARAHVFFPHVMTFHRRGEKDTLTNAVADVRLPATAKVLRHLANHLSEFAIKDACEWKHVFWTALRRYRRCVTTGVSEGRLELLEVAREAAWRWNPVVGSAMQMPDDMLRWLMLSIGMAKRNSWRRTRR